MDFNFKVYKGLLIMYPAELMESAIYFHFVVVLEIKFIEIEDFKSRTYNNQLDLIMKLML